MGVFKLGKMTFGSLFKKPETVLYPIEKKPQPLGLKGHIEVDAAQCILCGMCDKSCPTDCITVDKAVRTWSIFPFQCIQCGYCVQVCPKNCLEMDPNYWTATTGKDRHVVEIPEKGKEKAASNWKRLCLVGGIQGITYQSYPRAMLLSSAGFRTVLIWEPRPSMRYALAMPS